MANRELVIKVSEELLEYFANHNCMSEDGWFSHSSKLLNAFRNATLLPEGHGRLIDADAYAKKFDTNINGRIGEEYVIAPTIIKADRAEREG